MNKARQGKLQMMVLFAPAFFGTVLELDNIGWVGVRVQCMVMDHCQVQDIILC